MSIQSLPVFHGIDPDQIEKLLSGAREVTFPIGERLFQRDRLATDVLFLVEGRVKVHVDDMELAVLRAPCVVGELELLTEAKPAADVTVLDDCRAHAMSREQFRARLRAFDAGAVRVLENIGRALALRLAAMDERLIQILAGKDGGEPKDMASFRAKLFGEWSI